MRATHIRLLAPAIAVIVATAQGPAASAGTAPILAPVLSRPLARYLAVGDVPVSGYTEAESANVDPLDNPHAAGVAIDRSCPDQVCSSARLQALLDGARRAGAIPKFHYGPKKSRASGVVYGYGGDIGHVEWDPVELNLPPIPVLTRLRGAVSERR